MKRDWHLLGKIFTEIENEHLDEYFDGLKLEEQTKVLRHMELLIDAGYLTGIEIIYSDSGEPMYGTENGGVRITLDGYDFAERVQDEKLLNKTMSLIKKAGLMVSMETLKYFTPVAVQSIVKTVTGG